MNTIATPIHALLALSFLAAPLAACDDGGPEPGLETEEDQGEVGGKGDDLDATAERSAIMRAIHEDFVDGAVNGMPNEFLVTTYEVAGNYAWVQAKVQAPGGGEIDWTQSDYRPLIESGTFDGPFLAALVVNDGVEWGVVTADIGATDIWWDRLWLDYPIQCGLFPLDGRCTDVSEPAFGTDGRKAITEAIHDQFLDQELGGQANELVISWIRAGERYAFVQANVQGVGGTELDWSDSAYAESLEEGLFGGPHMEVFLERSGDDWRVAAHDIGATGVWWSDIWIRSEDVPCALFDVTECI